MARVQLNPPQQTAQASTPNDGLSQLHHLQTTVANAFNSKDVNALMKAYAPGESLFVFDVVGPPGTYVSCDAYREALKRFFATLTSLSFTMSDLDVTASGDVAYSRSLQRISGIRAKDGERVEYTVRVTDVYRRLNGKWLIVQEHVSLPLDRNTFSPQLDSRLSEVPHAAEVGP